MEFLFLWDAMGEVMKIELEVECTLTTLECGPTQNDYSQGKENEVIG